MKEQYNKELEHERKQYRDFLLMEACTYGAAIVSALNIHNKEDISYWNLLETGALVTFFFGWGQLNGLRRRFRASRIESLKDRISQIDDGESRQNG